MIEIKDVAGAVLYTFAGDLLKDAVVAGAKEGVRLLRANLDGANLDGANLVGANLYGASLVGANLYGAKADFYAVLDLAQAEVPGLYMALVDGRINGSTYTGECACLVGTIANVRHCNYVALEGLTPDGDRPAERLFLAIKKGDTPENNQVSAIVKGWMESYMASKGINVPKRTIAWE